MGFKSIGDLAISVLAKLDIEEPGTAGSDALNPQSGPHNTGREGDRVAMRMGKMADAETPAKLGGQEERQSEDTRGRICRVNRSLSYRKPMLTVLPAASASRHVSSARPTRCVGSHLKLVTVDGHAVSHPIA